MVAREALLPGVFLAEILLALAFVAPTFLLDTVFFLDPFLDADSFEALPFEAPFFDLPFETFAAFLRDAFFAAGRFLRALAAAGLRDFLAAAFFLLPDFFRLLAAALFTGIRFRLQDSPKEVGDYTCVDGQR
jgi:hypothetical protein